MQLVSRPIPKCRRRTKCTTPARCVSPKEVRPWATAGGFAILPLIMQDPILKTTRSQYGSPLDKTENDYVALRDGHVIGRIIHPQALQGRPWFWTITAREYPPSIHTRGYSPTRDQAMTDFKAQWTR